MCAVFKRERAFPDAHREGRATPGVHWVEEERDWSVEAACEHCGGYRMLLQVRDPEHGRLAEGRADAFLTRIHARGGGPRLPAAPPPSRAGAPPRRPARPG